MIISLACFFGPEKDLLVGERFYFNKIHKK